MSLTSLFLDMEDKNVLILGTGSVGVRRARRFLDTGANVSIVTRSIDPTIKEEFLEKGANFFDETDTDRLVDECDLVVVATSDHELNRRISIRAKDKLVNCASDISLSNVIVPSTFQIGDVTMSIYTGSKSPLMAKELRKKIQSIISHEDILNIELQEYIRALLKKHVSSQVERKQYMIKYMEDPDVQALIKEDNLDDAKELVRERILKLDK